MFRIFTIVLFKLKGWKLAVDKNTVSQHKKFVLVAAPHTSNWDAIYFTAAATLTKLKPKFLIKNTWMKFPFNLVFKPIGGIGVDNKNFSRNKSFSTIDFMVNLFRQKKELIIMIAPEGTRSKNPNWRTGFYRTALLAKVPLVLGYLDYQKKIAGFNKVFTPTGDVELDIKKISDFYSQFTGKNHHLFAPYKV